MSASPQILLVHQNTDQLKQLEQALLGAGYRVKAVTGGDDAIQLLERQQPELVLCDLRATARDGLTLSEQVQQDYPSIPRILIVDHSVLPEALEATAQGAFGFLSAPFNMPLLLDTVRAALDLAQQRRDQRWRAPIVGRSPILEQLLDQSRRAAMSDINLIISGPSGAGKETLARAIHNASRRAGKPIEVLDCSALPEQMIESELFGHRKGAFGSTASDQSGLISHTRGGTLVLKEIADLSPALQQKLLQTLNSGRVRPAGSDQEETIDIRVIATSQRNLDYALLSGEFNEELYYQLSVVKLEVPALQERAEDIPLLARHFLETAASEQRRRVRNLSPGAIHLLGLSAWPGNISQLKRVIDQAVSQSTSPVISEGLIGQALENQVRVMPSFNEARAEFERRYLIKLLQITEGNVTHAARIAERNRTDLYKLLGKHDLEPARFKVRRRRQRATANAQTGRRSGTDG